MDHLRSRNRASHMYDALRDSLLLPIIHREIKEIVFYNAPRTAVYRPIIRYLLVQRKMARYALPSEEIFEFLCTTYPDLAIEEYTLDRCEDDLLKLEEWGAVKTEQQRGRANTITEIRKRRLKAQIGDYAMAVEEALIAIELDRPVRGSLDASWLDTILLHVRKIDYELRDGVPAHRDDRQTVWGAWRRAHEAFQKMGDNANAFYAPFYETRVLDLIDTETFHKYKERLVEYVQDFGERLISDAGTIRGRLGVWDENGIRDRLLDIVAEMDVEEAEVASAQAAIRGERRSPVTREELRKTAAAQYLGFQEWFAPNGTYRSLSDAAVYAIDVIVRFARRLANEGRVPAARQREWQRLAGMFHACNDLNEAHRLAGVALGCALPRHISFDNHSMHERDSVWEQPPKIVTIRPQAVVTSRTRRTSSPIEDDSEALARMQETVRERLARERELWTRLFEAGEINVTHVTLEDPLLRDLLVEVIGRCLSTQGRSAEGPDGTSVRLMAPVTPDVYGEIRCSDGIFVLPAYRLKVSRPEGMTHALA